MRADVAGLEVALTEAQGLIDSEDYVAATDKANGARDKAVEVAEQINQAIAKKK
jgi:hypothetical protein